MRKAIWDGGGCEGDREAGRFVLMQTGKDFWSFITDHCAPQVELLVIVPTILF